MSAALVKQALEIVDPDFTTKASKKKTKTNSFLKEKLRNTSIQKGKNRLDLSREKRYTIEEARRSVKSKDQILRDNLYKLELIKKHSKVHLDPKATAHIIQRAVSRRPISSEQDASRVEKTAFTEEDFKKFEEEYMNSED
ncbi:active regulator of SIRT1-like [Anthonomus grandis grandis]|uniref:active regulator of SIRT1-like n=1 Tax=Anthonomus grandis grandis TaxID=2921223 RepID=UPI002165D60E|nr:active regulator of SIRT1-like [Anthonomus grandis grandis]